MLTLAVLALTLVLMANFLNSCTSAFSDDPLGDSREAKAFIDDPNVSARDLETFDALRGCFESMYPISDSSDASAFELQQRATIAVDAYRAQIQQGRWPSSHDVFATGDAPLSPQLWVRLAELSQDYLERETGETWRVIDFEYPFPNNGPIPVPPRRDENDAARTLLVCESGNDVGLTAVVSYYRWRTPAVFVDNLSEERQRVEQDKAALDKLRSYSPLAGYSYLLEDHGRQLCIWSNGTTDSLRNPGTFSDFAHDVRSYLGAESLSVALVEADAPIVLTWGNNHDYPNTSKSGIYSFSAAQRELVNSLYISASFASADVLLSLSLYSNSGESSLRGTLVPDAQYVRIPWAAPKEGSAFDDGLVACVANARGIDQDNVIAISYRESSDAGAGSNASGATSGTRRGESEVYVHVIMPAGAMPESPAAFGDAASDLLQAIWSHYYADSSTQQRRSLYVRFYVIDPDESIVAGATCSFDELRAALRDNPQSLGSNSPSIRLSLYDAVFAWEGEDYPSEKDFQIDLRQSVGGYIRDSRAWFLNERGLG